MFNLEAYLAYIGVDQKDLTVNHATLTLIVKKHLYRFQYQNTLIYREGLKPVDQRTIPSLHVNDLFDWMVTKKQPGFCFQTVELLATALTQLGFTITKHLTRVVVAAREAINEEMIKDLPLTHAVILAELAGKRYFIDIAMALNSIRFPLPLEFSEQTIDRDCYLITSVNAEWRVEVKLPMGWFCLHQTLPEPATKESFLAAHNQVFTMARALPIRDEVLILGKVTDEKRKEVCWMKTSNHGFFISIRRDATKKKEEIASFTKIIELAETKCGTRLPSTIKP